MNAADRSVLVLVLVLVLIVVGSEPGLETSGLRDILAAHQSYANEANIVADRRN